MQPDRWDAIVVGAGLGGLAAAVTLGQAGKRVLVLEQQRQPGGYAQGFRQGRSWFDVSLHTLDGVAPGGWGHFALRRLGILEGLAWRRVDPFYQARFPEHTITAHADPVAYEAELIRHFPAERRSIRALFRTMLGAFHEARQLRDDLSAGHFPGADIGEVFPNLVHSMGKSLDAMMSEHVRSPELKAILAADWMYYGLPPSTLSGPAYAMAWASYHYYGAFYPVGGSRAMTGALVERIRSQDGAVELNQSVVRVEVEGGVARRVHTRQGLEVEAPVVVSNASPARTFCEWMDEGQLPQGYLQRIRSIRPSLGSLNVYVEADAAGMNGAEHIHERFIAEGYDADEQHSAVVRGDWQRAPMLVVDYCHADPSSATDGKRVFSIMTLAPCDFADRWGTGGEPGDYSRNPRYLELKQGAAEALLRRAEQHVPGLSGAVTRWSASTPLTNLRYTGNAGGAIFGGEQSADNVMLTRLQQNTPVANLWLAGAWTTPGGGQTAALISGIDAGERALKYLERPAPSPRPALAQGGGGGARAAGGGEPGPAFALRAAGSGREVTERSLGPYPLVLLFHGAKTAAGAGRIMAAIRARYPLVHQVKVANVVGLGNVPSLLRPLVRRSLDRAYRDAARKLPSHADPAEYVLILPDWTGEVTKAYGVEGRALPAAVVLDRTGGIQARVDGPGTEKAIVEVLQWL